MRRNLTRLLCCCLACLGCDLFAAEMSGDVMYRDFTTTEYGQLEELAQGTGDSLDSIAVKGAFGKEDFLTVRKWIKEGRLRVVNLENARIENNEIPDGIFESTSIQRIILPDGVETIGKGAFQFSPLRDINFPASIKSIGMSCFRDCIHLGPSVTLPPMLREIEYATFLGCNSIEKVEIPEGVEKIGDSAFEHCVKLRNVKFPESLLAMGSQAFFYGIALEEIELPSELRIMGQSCFSTNLALKRIVCNADVPPVAINTMINGGADFYYYAFNNDTPRDIPVYVPDESVKDYKNVLGWDYFTNILPKGSMSGINNVAMSQQATVAVNGDRIRVVTPEDSSLQMVHISSIAGIGIYSGEVCGEFVSEPLVSGIYIVKCGAQTHKLMVR